MRYKLGGTHKHDILSVYCWDVIFFDLFIHNVYLQKVLHCLIIYSYKTNSSFLLCSWNLRSIRPSDFKKRVWNCFVSSIYYLDNLFRNFLKTVWNTCFFGVQEHLFNFVRELNGMGLCYKMASFRKPGVQRDSHQGHANEASFHTQGYSTQSTPINM